MKLPTKIIITLFILFASKLVIANPLETIRDTTQSWADAFNSRDTENILDHYSEEAVFWGTVSPTLRDEPAEVRDYFEVIGPDARVLLGEQRPRVFGEIAVNTGYYQFSDMHDGKKTLVPARFSFVYERNETGAWLIVDHHSSSVPTLNQPKHNSVSFENTSMSEADEQAAVDALCRYYDAISSGDYAEIPKLCAEVLSVISLYGTATLTSGEAIVQTYENLWASWNDQGIMQKIGYDREQFKVINVQDNVKLVQTELTNYNKDGGERSSWNCTYVMVKHNDEWLMSLATSDNVAGTTIQDGKV